MRPFGQFQLRSLDNGKLLKIQLNIQFEETKPLRESYQGVSGISCSNCNLLTVNQHPAKSSMLELCGRFHLPPSFPFSQPSSPQILYCSGSPPQLIPGITRGAFQTPDSCPISRDSSFTVVECCLGISIL